MRQTSQAWFGVFVVVPLVFFACGDDGHKVGARVGSGGAAGGGAPREGGAGNAPRAGSVGSGGRDSSGGTTAGGSAGMGTAGEAAGGTAGTSPTGGSGATIGEGGTGGASEQDGGSFNAGAGGANTGGANTGGSSTGGGGTGGGGGGEPCGDEVCTGEDVCCGPTECGYCVNRLSGAACPETCDPLGEGGASGYCNTGCQRLSTSPLCLDTQVLWECGADFQVDLLTQNCEDTGTALPRYCCPTVFYSVCVN
jgi:hypothetical protein